MMHGAIEARRRYIRQVNFLEDLTDQQIDDIADGLLTVQFKPNQTIFSCDAQGDSLFILMEGKVELYIEDYAGDKITLKVATPGDYFGELAVLGSGKRTATARALEQCVCYELTRPQMLDFLHQKPAAAIAVLASLSRTISLTNAMLTSRISRNVEAEKIAQPTQLERILQRTVRYCGSVPFLMLNVFFIAFWVIWNTGWIPGLPTFDIYPFVTLFSIVSVEMVFLAILMLTSQNMQSLQDTIHNNIEYEVNLKADLEIAHLHEKLDRYQEENMKALKLLTKAYGV